MSDGLITLNEQELLRLQHGEILEKPTVDGGTTVNIRMVIPSGLPHEKVMERAKALGFGRPVPATKVASAAVVDMSKLPPPKPTAPDANPALLKPQPPATPSRIERIQVPIPRLNLAGEGVPHTSPTESASVAGPPPAVAPPAAPPATPPAPPPGAGVVKPNAELW